MMPTTTREVDDSLVLRRLASLQDDTVVAVARDDDDDDGSVPPSSSSPSPSFQSYLLPTSSIMRQARHTTNRSPSLPKQDDVNRGAGETQVGTDAEAKHKVPLEILCDHMATFLDRTTFNDFSSTSKQAHRLLKRHIPPWPSKLSSHDHSCRIRCLTFNLDATQLACGCTDGLIRRWTVTKGEQPPLQGHMRDESVLAVAYSNDHYQHYHHQHQHQHQQQHQQHQQHGSGSSGRRRTAMTTTSTLLASSSTDHTIRIFDLQQEEERVRRKCREQQRKQHQEEASSIANLDDDDDNDDDVSMASGISAELENSETSVHICISAGHAYCLSFSPDDSYLVSGHHVSRPAGRLNDGGGGGTAAIVASSLESISIWDVATGFLLRTLPGGGMPVAFVNITTPTSQPLSSSSSSSSSPHNSRTGGERLISTCASDGLKMWSLNHNPNSNHSTSRNNALVQSRDGSNHHHLTNRVWSPGDDNNHVVVQNDSRCVRRWFLGSYSTVMPHPTKDDNDNIMVASIDETKEDSFSVWNTSDPTRRRTFRNISPYEIRISTNGRKVASVDDFSRVKVWRIEDGKLLSTYEGIGSAASPAASSGDSCCGHMSNTSSSTTTSSSGFMDDSAHGSITSGSDDASECYISGGIHEIAFAQDSTVAVVSRHYNEIHLFNT